MLYPTELRAQSGILISPDNTKQSVGERYGYSVVVLFGSVVVKHTVVFGGAVFGVFTQDIELAAGVDPAAF